MAQVSKKCHICSKRAYAQLGDYWLCNEHYIAVLQKMDPKDAPTVVRRAPATGTQVSLYHEGETGEKTKWATVCEDHGGIVYHETKAAALSELSHPENWCPECQEQSPRSNPKLTVSRGRVLAKRKPIKDIYTAKDWEFLKNNIIVVGPFGPVGEFFGHHKTTCVAYFLQDDKDRQTVIDYVKSGEAIPMFQQHLPLRIRWREGGTLQLFWKNRVAKKYLASAIQFHFEDWKTIRKPEGERVLVLTHMAVKPRYRRNKLNAYLIDFIVQREQPDVVVFHEPTEDGWAFMRAYGGEEYQEAVRRLGAK